MLKIIDNLSIKDRNKIRATKNEKAIKILSLKLEISIEKVKYLIEYLTCEYEKKIIYENLKEHKILIEGTVKYKEFEKNSLRKSQYELDLTYLTSEYELRNEIQKKLVKQFNKL